MVKKRRSTNELEPAGAVTTLVIPGVKRRALFYQFGKSYMVIIERRFLTKASSETRQLLSTSLAPDIEAGRAHQRDHAGRP